MAKVNTLLRSARLKRRWPVKTAASHAEVSTTTYLRWERGIQNPHLVNLQVLCDIFDLPPEKLGYGNLVAEGEIEPGEASPQKQLEKKVQILEFELAEQRRRNRQLDRALSIAQQEQATLREEAARARALEQQLQSVLVERAELQGRLHQMDVERAELRHHLEIANADKAAQRKALTQMDTERIALRQLLSEARAELEEKTKEEVKTK